MAAVTIADLAGRHAEIAVTLARFFKERGARRTDVLAGVDGIVRKPPLTTVVAVAATRRELSTNSSTGREQQGAIRGRMARSRLGSLTDVVKSPR
jgi:hypothetical protein